MVNEKYPAGTTIDKSDFDKEDCQRILDESSGNEYNSMYEAFAKALANHMMKAGMETKYKRLLKLKESLADKEFKLTGTQTLPGHFLYRSSKRGWENLSAGGQSCLVYSQISGNFSIMFITFKAEFDCS